jgi:hypothetical protein
MSAAEVFLDLDWAVTAGGPSIRRRNNNMGTAGREGMKQARIMKHY